VSTELHGFGGARRLAGFALIALALVAFKGLFKRLPAGFMSWNS
jgi:hypothetical protein